MGTAYVSAKCSQGTNKATITWDSNFNVTVTITSGSLAWRVRGRASDGDSKVYCSGDAGVKSGSFSNGTSGKTYIFQVYDTVEETYANSGTTGGNDSADTSDFTLTSGGSDSGGGGSGGNTGQTYFVYISSSNGTSIEVLDANFNAVNNMGTVYSGDYIVVKCTVLDGYTLSSFSVSGATYVQDYYGYEVYQVTGNVRIYASAESDSGGSGTGGNTNTGNNRANLSAGFINPNDGYTIVASTTATWNEDLKVTIGTVSYSTSSVSCKWRIKPLNGGDPVAGTDYGNTFYAEEGITYVFQACVEGPYGSWGNSTDGSSYLTVSYSNGGGSSGDNTGGDDSGGSGGGTTNNGLKEYEFTALGVRAKATYTSGPEVTITILSWSGYGSIPYWRIKGVKSEGDGNTYLEQNNKSSNSFDSVDLGYGDGYDDGGKNYIFQVCKDGSWNNDGGDASKFLVDFSLAGEGGGNSDSPVTLNIIQGEGTELTVKRIQSANGYIGVLDVNTSHQVWYGTDVFEITAKALDGYELNYYSSGGVEVGFILNNFYQISENEYSLIMNADASIATTATLIASARIFDKNTSNWYMYAPYIYDGSNWNRYRPYIYDGSNWNAYS